jgi:hypothetical protein
MGSPPEPYFRRKGPASVASSTTSSAQCARPWARALEKDNLNQLHAPTVRKRAIRRGLWPLVGAAVLGMLGLGIFWVQHVHASHQAFMPPGMAAAQYADGATVGDLGGVPVTIPRHFANFVEYESDPLWSEGRTTSRGLVTHASKLVSFGFYVRFPDMAGESTPELRDDKTNQTIFETTWMNVGITTGKLFPDSGFLDRRLSHINDPGQLQYELLPASQNGLIAYEPSGIDPKTQRPWREHADGPRIYVHRDESGAVDAYIRCSNQPHESAPCEHTFSLEPRMTAKVEISYRRGLLPHWREIQASASQLILGFEAR